MGLKSFVGGWHGGIRPHTPTPSQPPRGGWGETVGVLLLPPTPRAQGEAGVGVQETPVMGTDLHRREHAVPQGPATPKERQPLGEVGGLRPR